MARVWHLVVAAAIGHPALCVAALIVFVFIPCVADWRRTLR